MGGFAGESAGLNTAAWAAAGMTLGSVLEASILVEVGGGSGSIVFPTANVTAQ